MSAWDKYIKVLRNIKNRQFWLNCVVWDFWFVNIGGKRLSSVWFLAPFNFCSIRDDKISVNAAKSGKSDTDNQSDKGAGEKRGSFERLQKPQFWQNFGILAARWKKSVPTIVWWHCAWFRRRPGFILSLWLSLRIHNCYLMARKEIANKYSLLSCAHIFPENNKVKNIDLLQKSESFGKLKNPGRFNLYVWHAFTECHKIWPDFSYFVAG